LLIDATCVPVDIRHPTDLSLLNEARELTEALIDAMHSQMRDSFSHKPRTHRKQARQQFLAVAKKKHRINKIRKAIRQQLGHLKRNLTSIDALTACGAGLLAAGRYVYQKLLVVTSWSVIRAFLTSLTADVFPTASSALARLMSGQSCVARHAATLSWERRSSSR
jgi:hypothetical protein